MCTHLIPYDSTTNKPKSKPSLAADTGWQANNNNNKHNKMIIGDKLNMAVFLWYATVHVYTGQVTFCKVPEKHDHV